MKCLCGHTATHKVTFKDTFEINYYCTICGYGMEACEDEYMKCDKIAEDK